MGIGLLHPWGLAIGAAALGIPVLIHYLTRPRPMVYPLSTIRFVILAVQERRSRRRLRDIVILALRVLAIAALAWTFARPQSGRPRLISAADNAEAARVVLVDVSQSMAARTRGIETFERARARAADYLSHRSGLCANLLLAAARPQAVFDRCSTNFEALRDSLARCQALPQRLDAPAALRAASDLLSAADTGDATRRELVIISDFQRDNWTSADFSVLPESTLIVLESVAEALPPANAGIRSVVATGHAAEGKASVEVEVGNYSDQERTLEVEVQVAGGTVRCRASVPAYQKAMLHAELALQTTGWPSGAARLLNLEDALAEDDLRPFVLRVRPATTFGLITRQRDDRRATSSNLLERALAPAAPGSAAPGRIVRLDPSQLDRETLAPADVIVLDHPGKLEAEAAALIASLLQRGRAGLYLTAEPVDATNLKLLADAAGGSLQMPVEFAPPPAERPRRDLFLGEVRRDSRVLAVFGDELSALSGPLRFGGGLISRRTERGIEDDILARFNDQSVALVQSACGAGALTVLNVDLTASDLPASGLFVPLLAELTEKMLGERRDQSGVAPGEPLVAYLPADAGGLDGLRVLAAQAEAGDLGVLREEKGGIIWQWSAVGPPGVYAVAREDPVFAIAAALPAEESDLRALPESVLRQRLSAGRKVDFRATAEPEDRHDDRWTWFAVICALLLMGEVVALKAFRT